MASAKPGWAAPASLALLAALLSVLNPALLLVVPLGLVLLTLPPRRPMLILLGGLLLALSIYGGSGDAVWWIGRGWALVLGAWFVVAIALRPDRPFIDHGLTAVFGATASAALLLATRSGWSIVDAAIAHRLRESAANASAQWAQLLQSDARQSEVATTMARAADLQALVYPALLGLASLAALAVSWHVWRRLALGEARPLNRLREFRFRDELVWLVVIAILLLVLPLNGLAARAGTNLAAFMGALYALRGLAVVVSLFGAPGPVGLLMTGVAVLFLFPMVAAGTLVLGLSDTWLDLRARVKRAAS